MSKSIGYCFKISSNFAFRSKRSFSYFGSIFDSYWVEFLLLIDVKATILLSPTIIDSSSPSGASVIVLKVLSGSSDSSSEDSPLEFYLLSSVALGTDPE